MATPAAESHLEQGHVARLKSERQRRLVVFVKSSPALPVHVIFRVRVDRTVLEVWVLRVRRREIAHDAGDDSVGAFLATLAKFSRFLGKTT